MIFGPAFLLLAISSPAPDFVHDVAPIVYRECTPCHHLRGPAPFPLENYEDVRKHARQIAVATERRYMPPWPPDASLNCFQDERRLTAEQIRIIARWVAAGAPQGPAADAPAAPQYSFGWRLGKPDLILRAGHALTVPASGSDVFWNFLLKPDLKQTRYVRAIEIQPGPNGTIHHANLVVDRTGSTLRLEKTEGTGFPGMDVVVDRSPFDPESHFLFWKPGSLPYSEPDGLSWRLDPGNVLVLNTHIQPSGKAEHIQPSGKAEQIQPAVGLYFTETPPSKFPILIELEDDGALDIPAGARDFAVKDDFTMPADADVLAVYPHAHYLGKLLEGYATLPDGTRRWLIRIPDCDLNWQAVYRYCQPVFLPKGSVISMRFHYDNSAGNPRNPNHPPKRVEGGNRAVDEMGHLWLQVLPRGKGDHRRVIEEALMRHKLEEYPNDFSAHLNLGAILLSRLDAQDAVTMFKAAICIDPSRPEAHDMLGSALENLGRLNEAIAEHQIALKADPGYMAAHYNLAGALARAGRLDQAIENLKIVAAAYPNVPQLQKQLTELESRAERAATDRGTANPSSLPR